MSKMVIPLLLIGVTTGHSQPAAFDDFERTALGPNWSISFPASGNQVQIIGNSDLGMVAGPQGFFLANWTGTSFGPDQFCEAVIPQDAAPGWSYQPYVRWRSSDRARYGFGFDDDPNQPLYFNKWYFKYDGVAGPDTRMFGLVNGTQAPRPGDTLRVEIRGYTLYGFWNGRLMATATDTAANRIANGLPGLAARVTAGNQAITGPAKVWESWRGGALALVAIHPYRLHRFPELAPGNVSFRGRNPLGRLALSRGSFAVMAKSVNP